MVKEPNGVAEAMGDPASAGASAVVEPSKVNASSPGLVKTSQFKKRKAVRVKKTVAAAAAANKVALMSASTVGGDALASGSMPQPAEISEASPVAQAPKPATDAEGSLPAPMPANAQASASAAKKNPADIDAGAAATSSKGKGMSTGNSGGDRKMKNRKERVKERMMNAKGRDKKEGSGGKRGGGFIFMCNQQTKQECYQKRLFGLPNGKIGMVKKIRPGTKLFLYDFDLKLLYGVYKAASNGGLNLVQEAFRGKFPAQVKFKIDRDCLPLRESSFKHAIKENYSARSKFDPELSSKQVQRLIALFKPANVPQSVPNNRLDERRHNEERRQPYHFKERKRSLPIEELRQPRFDEQRHPSAIHVPVEDPYRAPRFAPLPVESRLGRSLDDHHIYYEPVHLAPEPRHIPLAIDSRHVPLVLERQPVHSVSEPRHVPSAYYRTLAPSDDLYYQSVADLGPERFADITAERTARDPIIPRDRPALPVELSARTEHLEEHYRTGGTHGAHVEELYHPREHTVRADRMGISTRADRLEEMYHSEQLAARAVGLPRHPTYITSAYETHRAYAEPSQRSYSARANASGGPVSSLYSFSGGPVYR
ncbi:hypothetical protein QOZ80_6AG0514610 [Eleusine coracana subsp. coracana]|nr:hypothetical protein QOZ80_6AG0514610 [Eleusine coracana subsp. coracana]